MADVGLTTLLWAIIGGVIPTFLWMWFWFNQDKETKSTVFLSFLYILGMICVFIILPFKYIIESTNLSEKEYLLVFAGIEEICKVLLTTLIAFRFSFLKKPTDYTLYLITVALGFSALENTLYLIEPITKNSISFVLFTGNLRFVGATLLHTVCVSIVGIMIGIAYYDTRFMRIIHGLFGLGLAIGLHAIFNYFILLNTTRSIMIGLAGLWFVGIIVVVLFGRLQTFHQYQSRNQYDEELLSI
jgi:RsiW-degrading membrane proteinase PrsW (M82 family)